MPLKNTVPHLSLCSAVVAVFLFGFGTVPSLCHLAGFPTDDEFRLSLPLLFAAIPASFSLKLPLGDEEIETNIREAIRVFERQNVAELETESQRLCDAFETFSFFDLTGSLLSEALRYTIEVDDGQDITARLKLSGTDRGHYGTAHFDTDANSFMGLLCKVKRADLMEFKDPRSTAIVNDVVNEVYCPELNFALTKFLSCNLSAKDEIKALGSVSNKIFVLLFYDRLYGLFEQQIEEIIDEKNYAPNDANRVEFALKWLKQMRKEISRRYEKNEAKIKHLLRGKSRDLESLINWAESDRKETKEQLNKEFTRKVGEMRDRLDRVEMAKAHIGQLGTVDQTYAEKSERFDEAIQNRIEIGRIASEMGGTGDRVVIMVRTQIKLSLTMSRAENDDDTDDALPQLSTNNDTIFKGKALNRIDSSDQFAPSSSSFCSSSSFSAVEHCQQLVLSEFLQQNDVIATDKNGGVIFDARDAFCNFLTYYGYSNLYKEFASTNGSKLWQYGGRSLMRTLRLIRPKLETAMGRILEYGDHLKAFGHTFEKSVAKIEQMGAFVLYFHLYNSLLDQHLFGWTEKSKKAIPVLYRPFMCPEEFIGYWLDQMCLTLMSKLEKAKRELNKLLERDRKMLIKEMEKLEIGKKSGENWIENANRTLAIYEEKPSRKKFVRNYLKKIGRKLEDKWHMKFAGERPQRGQKDSQNFGRGKCTTIECPQGKRDEIPPKRQQIWRAIELNEEVAKMISG